MSFLEQVLPVDIRPGSSGGPGFSTTVKQLRGGGEYRNRLWEHPLRMYEVGYNVRDRDTIEERLQAFIYETGGAHSGFRARDWSDYQATNEQLGTGDGVTFWWRLTKRYGSYSRRILKPDPATVTITLNGTPVDPDDFAIDGDNGIVVFYTPPATDDIVAWSGEFHVPVRFDTDEMSIQMLMQGKGSVSDLTLREIRIREVIDTGEFATLRAFLGAYDRDDLIAMMDLLDIRVNYIWPEAL